MTAEIHGCILTPRGFVDGTLAHLDGRIRRIEGTPIPDERARDEAHRFVLPGFIDSHVHGGGGHDFMDGTEEAFRGVCLAYARHGTTSLLATTTVASHKHHLRFLEICTIISSLVKLYPSGALMPHTCRRHNVIFAPKIAFI